MPSIPPSENSRYLLSEELELEGDDLYPEGALIVSLPEPVDRLDLSDDITHKVTSGDTLMTIAARYYSPIYRACQFFWTIADYQQPPILDPLAPLEDGTTLRIPSLRTLQEIILSEDRREISTEQLATEYK